MRKPLKDPPVGNVGKRLASTKRLVVQRNLEKGVQPKKRGLAGVNKSPHPEGGSGAVSLLTERLGGTSCVVWETKRKRKFGGKRRDPETSRATPLLTRGFSPEKRKGGAQTAREEKDAPIASFGPSKIVSVF